MTKQAVIRMVLGLALVLLLGIGGFWRARVNQADAEKLPLEHPYSQGETMGTTYSIRLTGEVQIAELNAITQQIESELVRINRQMSTWDPESEISRFNHARSSDPFPVSEAFANVVMRALEFSESSGGAFDPTLQPLLNLWGFGSEATEMQVPSAAAIETVRSKTGWQKITLHQPSSLRKSEPELSLALGAIAKGYGVDALCRILEEAGHQNWFVEIGGEVAVRGLNPDQVPWKIGIQHPGISHDNTGLQGILSITNGAVATSGDYRNYLEVDGTVYSHILDPRSGKAVLSSMAGVTVYAASCMDADAAATALFVMGAEEGLAWIERQQGMEAMFLLRRDDGAIIEQFSSGFIGATGYTSAVDGDEVKKTGN
jgi:thiamine biosynthesis lipoprotein